MMLWHALALRSQRELAREACSILWRHMRLLPLCALFAGAHGLVPADTSRGVVFRQKAKLDPKSVFGSGGHQLVAAKVRRGRRCPALSHELALSARSPTQ